ncbi:Hypothetical_protein [Hexamita inflata]|uniref:Hypothetical_protein n=1 Tax=Hexamita inflata TaxID=28002 RepID=A0AA86TYX2_9EUKA|nr:Hypothetical protein HINF_LOCUS19967 [Hexamita inflata]
MVYGSLICYQCNVRISSSSLSFLANGQSISSIMQITNIILQIINVQLQFRFDSVLVGGLVIQVQENLTFIVTDLDIVGYNFQENSQSSNLINKIDEAIIQTINISNLNVCSNIQYLINNGNASLVSLTEQPNYTCENICGQNTPIYGLCQIDLVNGYLNIMNNTKYCVNPFVYNGEECVCIDGYLLNGTICINIISTLTNLDKYIFNNVSTLNINLQNNISNISNQLVATKDYLYNYFTSKTNDLWQFVNSTFDNINNKQNQFELVVSSNISQLQIETQNLQSNLTTHKIINDQLRVDLQSLNSSFNTQVLSLTTKLQNVNNSLQTQINTNLASLSSLSTQFNSFKLDAVNNNTQLNTQIQNIISTANSQKLVTDSLRADLTSSNNSLQTQINNINSVNNAQNADINMLKNRTSGLNLQQICYILYNQGVCSKYGRCCSYVSRENDEGYLCVGIGQLLSDNECGYIE